MDCSLHYWFHILYTFIPIFLESFSTSRWIYKYVALMYADFLCSHTEISSAYLQLDPSNKVSYSKQCLSISLFRHSPRYATFFPLSYKSVRSFFFPFYLYIPTTLHTVTVSPSVILYTQCVHWHSHTQLSLTATRRSSMTHCSVLKTTLLTTILCKYRCSLLALGGETCS